MFFSYIIKTCMILSMTEWVLGICPHLSEWICSVPSVVNEEGWSPILQQAELEMPLSTHRSSAGRIKVISSCRFPNSWADNVWWSECCPKSFTGRWNVFNYLGGKRWFWVSFWCPGELGIEKKLNMRLYSIEHVNYSVIDCSWYCCHCYSIRSLSSKVRMLIPNPHCGQNSIFPIAWKKNIPCSSI